MATVEINPEKVADNQSHELANPPSAKSPHHPHHAHHLRYGQIDTETFLPEHDDFDDAENEPTERAKGHRLRQRYHTLMEIVDSESRRIHNTRRYLIRKPRALQYFRGKTLVRGDEERGSNRLELFFDLTFVGIIAVLAADFVDDPTGANLVLYLISFTTALTLWQWMREIFDSFYKDDLSQRVLVVYVIACLIIFGNNAPEAAQSLDEGPGRAASIGSFLLGEAGIYAYFLFYSFHIKAYRLQLRLQMAGWVITTALWIGAIFATVRVAIALSVLALGLEYIFWFYIYSPAFKKMMKVRYSSAVNIEHQIDRFSDFFTVVMGEFIYSVFDGSPAGLGFTDLSGRAVLAVLIAFSFQLLYMQGGGSRSYTHPIRKGMWHTMVWFFAHWPLISGLTICGDTIAELIKDNETSQALRWVFCETFAVGMLSLWILGWAEVETDEKGVLWIRKQYRMLARPISCLVAVFLPLSHVEDVDSSTMMGILAMLAVLTVLWEMISSIDGPNAEPEIASEDILRRVRSNVEILKTAKTRDDQNTADRGLLTPALSTTTTLSSEMTTEEEAKAQAEELSQRCDAMMTPEWKGWPTFFEPGWWKPDWGHQRELQSRKKTACT